MRIESAKTAYHKLVAPEGLREQIEAGVREEFPDGPAKRRGRAGWAKFLPAGAVCAAVCAAVIFLTVPGKTGGQSGTEAVGMNLPMRIALFPPVSLITGDGTVLDGTETELTVSGGGTEPDARGTQEKSVIFRVETSTPVRVSADSGILSVYDADTQSWSERGSEFTLKDGGELRVLLTFAKDGETEEIELRSEAEESVLRIAYDAAADRYTGICLPITGE